MGDLVPVRKSTSTQMSLADIQNYLDSRKEVEETRAGGASTIKARVEQSKRDFEHDPLKTLVKIEDLATTLADAFDGTITPESAPLTQDQINRISNEYLQFDRLKTELAALEPRYRELIFAHLDKTGPKIPGRPASQVPGKVEANVSGPHYIFERRGGNREDPTMESEGLRAALPAEVAAQVFATVQHPPVPAWEEEVFDEAAFGKLVQEGVIDLDTIAPHLIPGKWRTPTFNKTLVDGDK